jgi:hypothetical protein
VASQSNIIRMAARCLLHGRGGLAMAEVLNVGCNVDRTDSGNRGHAVGLQPRTERADRPHVGPAGVCGLRIWAVKNSRKRLGGTVPGGGDKRRGVGRSERDDSLLLWDCNLISLAPTPLLISHQPTEQGLST